MTLLLGSMLVLIAMEIPVAFAIAISGMKIGRAHV